MPYVPLPPYFVKNQNIHKIAKEGCNVNGYNFYSKTKFNMAIIYGNHEIYHFSDN